MKVICPICGTAIVVNGLGRKPLNVPLIKIRDTLLLHGNVRETANSLGCSPGFVYKILKINGLTPLEVLNGLEGRDSRKVNNR